MASDSIQTQYIRRTGKTIPVQLDTIVLMLTFMSKARQVENILTPPSDIRMTAILVIRQPARRRSTKRANVCRVIRISAITCVSMLLIQQISKRLLGKILNNVIDPKEVFLDKFWIKFQIAFNSAVE